MAGWPVEFEAEQARYEIGGVTFGGRPWERPTVLVGSIFYAGDKVIVDYGEGRVDREAVAERIATASRIAEEYGSVLALDAIFYTARAAENLLPLVAELFEGPVFLDGVEPEARIRAAQLAGELGLESRVVYNAVYTNSGEDELNALRDSGLEAALVMAFDASNPAESLMPGDRLRIAEALVEKARGAGATKILVDIVVLDPASIGISAAAVWLVKDRLGLPAGCAPANAMGPVNSKNFGEAAAAIHGGVASLLQVLGADFIFYGPIKRIKYVAPAVAVADALTAYLYRLEGKRPPRNHPINRVLRRLQKLFAEQG